jgi:predicted O-linked N-acetylglucosamine transferase (SPINDLY family)
VREKGLTTLDVHRDFIRNSDFICEQASLQHRILTPCHLDGTSMWTARHRSSRYMPSFLACYDGLNDKALMLQQQRTFLAMAPQLPREGMDHHVLGGGGDNLADVRLTSRKKGGGKIRVGFISTNFRAHSVGKLFIGLVQKKGGIDRSKFEVWDAQLHL